MTPLQKNWRALLRTPRSVDVDTVWAGVEARRSQLRVLRRVLWTALPLAAVAALALVLIRGGPAALERKDGGSLAQLVAAAQPAQFALSDGSQIALAAGARLQTRSLTGQLFATEVSAGRVTFDVVPNGPRVWEVTAGRTQVRVLGTRFSVERNAQGVEVSVARGRVQVTGPEVPGGSQQLQAGQSLRTHPTVAPARPALSAGSDAAAAGPEAIEPTLQPQAATAELDRPASQPTADLRAHRPTATSQVATPASERAADRSIERSLREADRLRTQARAERAADGSIERSLREADRARAQGQPELAAKLLARVIAEHPKDARAALAAFTLGELYLGPLGSPLRAARAFERAQQLVLPAALAEQGAARIFEAYGAAGTLDAAANAAHAYLEAYPNGTHRRAAERWANAP